MIPAIRSAVTSAPIGAELGEALPASVLMWATKPAETGRAATALAMAKPRILSRRARSRRRWW